MNRLTGWLALGNAIVLAGIAIFSSPARTTAADGWIDCCKCNTEHTAFCCDNCCWIAAHCDASENCDQEECRDTTES
jgi:hypothetical protein